MDSQYRFANINNEQLDLSNISTSVNASYMFSNCTYLESINFNNFDTTRTKDMSFMFSNCTSLKSIDLSNIDTSNVTNMNGMFLNCTSLENLDLTPLTTSNLETMDLMFQNCTSLDLIDLSDFDTTHINHMYSTFSNCRSLRHINFGNKFDFTEMHTDDFIFQNCVSIVSIRISPNNHKNANKIISLLPSQFIANLWTYDPKIGLIYTI